MKTAQRLVEAYLADVERAARRLPRLRREELRADIEAHLEEALPPGAEPDAVREVLGRLGRPEDIVADELPPEPVRGTREWAALILLAAGGFVAGFGWLVGVICLWASPVWTSRQKWLATFAVPFGFALPIYVLFFTAGFCIEDACTGGAETVVGPFVALAMVIAQITSLTCLARSSR